VSPRAWQQLDTTLFIRFSFDSRSQWRVFRTRYLWFAITSVEAIDILSFSIISVLVRLIMTALNSSDLVSFLALEPYSWAFQLNLFRVKQIRNQKHSQRKQRANRNVKKQNGVSLTLSDWAPVRLTLVWVLAANQVCHSTNTKYSYFLSSSIKIRAYLLLTYLLHGAEFFLRS
jgi:hypothetical protein